RRRSSAVVRMTFLPRRRRAELVSNARVGRRRPPEVVRTTLAAAAGLPKWLGPGGVAAVGDSDWFRLTFCAAVGLPKGSGTTWAAAVGLPKWFGRSHRDAGGRAGLLVVDERAGGAAVELAGARERERVDEAQRTGMGEAGEAGLEVGAQRFEGRWLAARNDQRGHPLAPARVGHAHDARGGDVRVARERVLHRGGIDVLAARHDAVVQPPEDVKVATLVDPPRVAGAQPRARIERPLAPKPVHPGRPAHLDAALDHPQLHAGQRRADAARARVAEPLGAHPRAALAPDRKR